MVKKIAAEPSLFKKELIAEGATFLKPAKPGKIPQTNSEMEAFVFQAQITAAMAAKLDRAEIPNAVGVFLEAISKKDWKFFSSLAGTLQHVHKPKSSLHLDRYRDISSFCRENACGTPETPCNAIELTKYLVSLGHRFDRDHDNQVPRDIRAVCKKLGYVLTGQR